MSPLTAFIIGAGANATKSLSGRGKPAFDQLKKDGYFPVAVDVESPGSLATAFAQINKELGPPNVVVFNSNYRDLITPPVPDDPLTLSVEALTKQTAVGLAVFTAAQEALSGFRSEANKGTHKTFIVTGNPLPWKLVSWRLMSRSPRPIRKKKFGARGFYYASLVNETTGGILDPLSEFFTSGPQHAQVYLDLVTREDQADWDYRSPDIYLLLSSRFTLKGKKWAKA
ncbi:hypothetical protein B0H17DRAFT_1075149 [Mycena rosella]|uniref:Uncharacterized protein n=1 Tax=Mycena rosella TaxID=1033263 RepID=A0AAD7GDV2_MYCRO|nr:hypothetical protein B0H17DRAFT_1075149 [Mycena rosella]